MPNTITQNPDSLVFENKLFSFTVDRKNGRVTKAVNLYTGKDVTSPDSSEFIFLSDYDEKKIPPISLERDNGEIKVTFENNLTLNMSVSIFDGFFTVELTSELDKSVKCVTFANICIDTEKDYLLNAIGMSAWTRPMGYGYRVPATSVYAKAYTMYDKGVKGAKLGIVFSSKEDAIPLLQRVMDNIDKKVGLVSKAGGAYAREFKGNFGDYAFCLDISPESIDETIDLLKAIGVDQYDIHQNTGKTFTQGDFTFAHTESGSAAEFYERYGKRFNDAGIDLALHTYAYYINPDSKNILSNPKWQKDLEMLESYTLREDISAEDTFIPTLEDASKLNARAEFFVKTSFFVLIDEELIRLQITGGSNEAGIVNCVRGACGTTAVSHKAGSEIKHLSGFFSILTPKLGSELFYHVADLTAKAYNEGGFTMLYIDAIDGLSRHLPEGHETWYYFHMFLHRVVSQCERDPIVETSAAAPSEWNVRGRCGAWDYAVRSVKKFTANHVKANLDSMSNNMTATLGWFNFHPDGNAIFKNTFTKTMFKDDLDFVGMNAVIHDMSMVYNPFSVSEINSNPFHKENVLYYYNNYSKLRKTHYFSDEVIEKVKSAGGEWRIVEASPDTYAFQEMHYEQYNFGNIKNCKETFVGQNKFEVQAPFIRIESRYSSLLENPETMVEFDETQSVGQSLVKTFTPFNMSEKGRVISVRVKGTGADGDAMLLSFTGISGIGGGRRDHFVNLDYEGWRDFVFMDYDNADYDIEKYKFDGIPTANASYSTYRMTPSQNAIDKVTVRTVGATGENAVIGDIKAYVHTDARVMNPTLTVGTQSMSFNCEMKGGEYLEYYPDTNKAILYHSHEQTTDEVSFTGSLHVEGEFEALYSAKALTTAPVRARVVFGFSGQKILN